jgi:hypothetical protein
MCKHENAVITVKQIYYSEIDVARLNVSDGSPVAVSYDVSCPDCGAEIYYPASRVPKWLTEIIQAL